jgi:hypothetical protein
VALELEGILRGMMNDLQRLSVIFMFDRVQTLQSNRAWRSCESVHPRTQHCHLCVVDSFLRLHLHGVHHETDAPPLIEDGLLVRLVLLPADDPEEELHLVRWATR